MKSILVAIVSCAALVLTAACGPPSDTEPDPTIDASAGTAVVQIPTATPSGFTNEQLRSPEFKECIDKLFAYALGATSHTHIYRDMDVSYGLEKHSHSVSYSEWTGFKVSDSGGGFTGLGRPAGTDVKRETESASYRRADARGPIRAACSSLLTSGDLSGN